jgi:hypothetical protein
MARTRRKPKTQKTRLGKEYINYIMSSDTMNPDHLIESFTSFLESLDYSFMSFEEWQKEYPAKDEMDLEEDKSYYLNEYLWEYLDDIAPNRTSFCSSDGDGALYGFWFWCNECGQQMDYDETISPAKQKKCIYCKKRETERKVEEKRVKKLMVKYKI